MTDATLLIPLAVFGLFFVARLILAPYWMHSTVVAERDRLRDELSVVTESPALNQPMNGGGVPVLGQQKPTHVGAQLGAIPRTLNEHGLMELVDGAVVRASYLDATELLEAIRQVVREELAAAVVRGRDTPSA